VKRRMAKPAAALHEDLAARKQSHLDLCAREDVEAAEKTTLFEQVDLVHDALPDLAVDDVDCHVRWLGKDLAAPLVITGMTGGTSEAFAVNRDLARIAEETRIAFGVGSQRAMQKHPESAWTYRVREFAPTTVVLANIGLGQARTMSAAELRPLIDEIGADALCLHLNVAQELIQPEGDRDFRQGTQAFRKLCRELPVPVIAKETGCGISREVALRLRAAGVKHIDVSGAGGTSWVRIEALRAPGGSSLGGLFRDWGIPTAASLLQVRGLGLQVIASGGVRDGLDVAKAIALGATLAGTALPVYQAYRTGGYEAARAFVDDTIAALRMAMLLTGARSLAELRRRPVVLGPTLGRWQRLAGSTPARRKT